MTEVRNMLWLTHTELLWAFVLLICCAIVPVNSSSAFQAEVAVESEGKKPDALGELTEVEGGFRVSKFVVDGVETTATAMKSMKVVRSGNQWTLFEGTKETSYADASDASDGKRNLNITALSGAEKDFVYFGIYEISEEGMKLCFSKQGRSRPSSFESPMGSGITLLELGRFRPPTVSVVETLPSWPVPGGDLRIVAKCNDPNDGSCHLEYKFDSTSNWLSSESNELLVRDLKDADLVVWVRSVSDRGGHSEPVVHTVPVVSPKRVAAVSRPAWTNSIGMKFVPIPAGEFAMGSATGERWSKENERPLHGVRIASEFHIGQFELRVSDYVKLYGTRPKIKEYLYASPADNDAWIEASPPKVDKFLRTLNELPSEMSAGRRYRLPTEEEWEYACRAGTDTPFWAGDILDDKAENFGGSKRGVAVYPDCRTGKGRPNPFGIYDMHGNVCELCTGSESYWGQRDKPASQGLLSFLFEGSSPRSSFVIRGGCDEDEAKDCRSAERQLADPNRIDGYIGGVRLVCEVGAPQKTERKPLDSSAQAWTGATGTWEVKDGNFSTGNLQSRTDRTMFTRDKFDDFTISFDVKVTGPALFGLRFRGTLINVDKDVTDGPMFLFAGPNRVEEDRKQLSWFTTMGRPRFIYASAPDKKKVIDQLVKSGDFNPVTITVKGNKVSATLHNMNVWDGIIPDMKPTGIIGLVSVSNGGGKIELRNFRLSASNKVSR